MPETKRPLKVFLCHAHSDALAVHDLYLRLRREGADVWLDKEKLIPGSDWEFEIRKAVRESDTVVVCLSQQFNQAGFRQKEMRHALDTAMEQPEGAVFIIPLRLEECEDLESLRKWHRVDLFEEEGYHRLVRALQARAEKVGARLRTRRRKKLATFDNVVDRKAQEITEKVPEVKLSIQSSIAQSFPAPGSKAEGITWDRTSIWLTDNSGVIFKVHPSGRVLDSFRSPEVTSQGITWEGSSFWVYTTNRSFIFQLQIAGSDVRTLSSFRSPAQVLGGGITQDMAWDAENLWYANEFKVYQLDRSGNVLSSFTFPKNVIGLAWDGSKLWIANNNFPGKASLNIVSTGGEVLRTSISPLLEINSMAWADGSLWTLGSETMGGNPMIYRLDIPTK